MKNSKGFIQIIIIILAIIAIAGGAYYFGTKNKTTPTSNPVASVQPSTNPTTIVDPTTNWKTFSDLASGVEFKYPNNWFVEKMKGWTLTVFLDDKSFVIPEASEFMTPIQVVLNEVGDTNTDTKRYSETTVGDAVKRFRENVFGEDVKETTGLNIDGHKATQLVGTAGPGMLDGQYFRVTFIQMDGKVLIVTLYNNKDFDVIYNQILSTFKFTK
jgi:hypothetical protein